MLVQSKSILAKLLASENLTVEHRKTQTAYFDTKNRVMVLPIWKDMLPELYDLLLGHEVGHALNTPNDGWHNNLKDKQRKGFKTYLNVIEDVRIEKLIQEKFPGLKTSFVKGYSNLMDRDFFGVANNVYRIDSLPLIDRINLHYKIGAYLNVHFSSDELKFVERLDKIRTWEDVEIIANELYENGKKELRKELEDQFFDDDSYYDGDYDDLDEDMDYDESDDRADGRRDGRRVKEYGSGDYDDLDPESITDKNFREKEKDFLSDDLRPYFYVNLPTPKLDRIVVPYKKVMQYHNTFRNVDIGYSPKAFESEVSNLKNKILTKFLETNKKYISYLIKEFELKRNARQFARASVSKTGELDMKKIFSYKINDDLFRRMTVVPKGKSHGLIMFIDYSGSMTDNIRATIEQTLILATFCRKVNIPFRVYAFTDNTTSLERDASELGIKDVDDYIAWRNYNRYSDTSNTKYEKFSSETNEIAFLTSSFKLKEYLSSEMSGQEFRESCKYWLLVGELYAQKSWRRRENTDFKMPDSLRLPEEESMNGTPLNETIVASIEMVKQFKSSYKLDVVNTVFLTDGESNETSLKFSSDPKRGTESIGQSYYRLNESNVIIRDMKTMTEAKKPAGADMTIGLLNMLKALTGVNTIGFFLTDARMIRRTVSSRADKCAAKIMDMDAKIREFKKTKFFLISNAGYDDYYIIPGGDDLQVKEDDLDVDSKSSKSELKSAFMKLQKSKNVNRVLLNRFVDKIA